MAATTLSLAEIRRGLAWRKQLDKLFVVVGLAVMLGCLATLALLFVDLVQQGASRFGWDFLTSFPSRKAERAGILSAAVGTSMIMIVTALVALPVGVAAAIYLEEYAPKNWFTGVIEINVTNLAGVPSIVYGLLALGLFVYQFGFGQSVLAAGLTLALLILPIVIVATRESLRSVPKAIREAAYGLGATRWEVTKDHVLPYSTGDRRDRADHHDRGAHLHRLPAALPRLGRLPVGELRLAGIALHGDADPDVQLALAPPGGLPGERGRRGHLADRGAHRGDRADGDRGVAGEPQPAHPAGAAAPRTPLREPVTAGTARRCPAGRCSYASALRSAGITGWHRPSTHGSRTANRDAPPEPGRSTRWCTARPDRKDRR